MSMSTISNPKLNWREFGEYIAAMRKKQGITQKEFAEMIGIHQPDVSVLEKGSRQSTVEMIWKVAEALSISPQKLFSRIKEI